MDIQTCFSLIEKYAPRQLMAPWDCSGCQVASHRQSVQHIGVALDPTPQTIQKALELGCDFLLTHHPLALKPTLPSTLNAYHEALRLLFRSDLPLYAAHTTLDANTQGPSAWFADALCLVNRTVLEPTAENPMHGFGCVGDLAEPLSAAELLQKIAEILPVAEATVIGNIPPVVTRVAYCTGSGASLISDATRLHADLYVTGDIKYHAALESQIALLDVGHHSLEEEMMRIFAAILQKECTSEQVSFIPSCSPYTLLQTILQKKS